VDMKETRESLPLAKWVPVRLRGCETVDISVQSLRLSMTLA